MYLRILSTATAAFLAVPPMASAETYAVCLNHGRTVKLQINESENQIRFLIERGSQRATGVMPLKYHGPQNRPLRAYFWLGQSPQGVLALGVPRLDELHLGRFEGRADIWLDAGALAFEGETVRCRVWVRSRS